jgi:hypothetical protein
MIESCLLRSPLARADGGKEPEWNASYTFYNVQPDSTFCVKLDVGTRAPSVQQRQQAGMPVRLFQVQRVATTPKRALLGEECPALYPCSQFYDENVVFRDVALGVGKITPADMAQVLAANGTAVPLSIQLKSTRKNNKERGTVDLKVTFTEGKAPSSSSGQSSTPGGNPVSHALGLAPRRRGGGHV